MQYLQYGIIWCHFWHSVRPRAMEAKRWKVVRSTSTLWTAPTCTSNTVLVGAALSTGKKHRPGGWEIHRMEYHWNKCQLISYIWPVDILMIIDENIFCHIRYFWYKIPITRFSFLDPGCLPVVGCVKPSADEVRDALSQRQMFTMFQHLGFHHVSPSNYWYYVVLFIGTIGFTPFFTMGDWVSPSFSTKRLGILGAIAASESGLQAPRNATNLGPGQFCVLQVSNQLRRHLHWRPGRGMGWTGWNDLQHFDHFQAFGDVCDRLLPGLQTPIPTACVEWTRPSCRQMNLVGTSHMPVFHWFHWKTMSCVMIVSWSQDDHRITPLPSSHEIH